MSDYVYICSVCSAVVSCARYAGAASIGFGGLTLRQREGGSVLVLEDENTFSAADKDDASFLITTWQEARGELIVRLQPCMTEIYLHIVAR